MSEPFKEVRKFRENIDRLHQPMYDFTILIQCIFSHHLYLLRGPIERFTPGSAIGMPARHLPKFINVPAEGALELALKRQSCPVVSIMIITEAQKSPETPEQYAADAMARLYTNTIAPIFLTFYEKYTRWIVTQFKDENVWPETFRFARIVRNAISHRSQIDWNNQRARSVTWRGLTYSPSDNGRRIFETDLSVGDLIVLMIDLSDCLDGLSCPLDPP